MDLRINSGGWMDIRMTRKQCKGREKYASRRLLAGASLRVLHSPNEQTGSSLLCPSGVRCSRPSHALVAGTSSALAYCHHSPLVL